MLLKLRFYYLHRDFCVCNTLAHEQSDYFEVKYELPIQRTTCQKHDLVLMITNTCLSVYVV